MLQPRAAARAARPDRDERARLARALAAPLPRGARARPPRPRDLADDGAQLRRDRRRARRARPLPAGLPRLRHDGDAAAGPLLLRADRVTRASCSATCRRALGDEARASTRLARAGRDRGLDAGPARQARSGRSDASRRALAQDRAALRAFPGYALRATTRWRWAEYGRGTSRRRDRARAAGGQPRSRCRSTSRCSATSTARSAGRLEARRQYALIGVIQRLLVANGVKTDLETALFDVDHGIRLRASLALARAGRSASARRSTATTSSPGRSRATATAARRSATRRQRPPARARATRSSSSTAAMIERCLGNRAAARRLVPPRARAEPALLGALGARRRGGSSR